MAPQARNACAGPKSGVQAFDSGPVDRASVPLAGGATRMVTVWRPKWGLGVPRGGGHGVLGWDGDCSHEEEQASVSHGHGIEQRGFSKNG